MYPSFNKPMAFAIAMISSNVVIAEQTDTSPPVVEVKIWGTEVNASSLDIDEDAIAIRQADHISDLLRFIPGIDVGGTHSLNQRITIRSLDDKDLRITVDGAVQNTYMFHHMGNLQIHSDILQAADIEVGNNSVLSAGLGGAARFKTRSASDLLDNGDRFGGRVNATYNSNASARGSITAYGQITDNVDVLAYINAVQRDNYEVGGGEIKDASGEVLAGTDGSVRGLEGDLSDTLLKLGYNITDNQRIKIGYEAYKDEGDYSSRPDMGLATDLAIGGGEPQLFPTTFTRDTLTLNYDASWQNITLEAVAFGNVSTLDRDELGKGRNSNIFLQTGEARNTGFNLFMEQSLAANHTLTYGAEYVNYQTDYQAFNNTGEVLTSGNEEASEAAIFIQDRIAMGNFSVIPGVRFNQWDITSNLVEDTFSEPTLALALEYTLQESTTLKISANQLFKGPELSEVFTGAGNSDVRNPELKAETGLNSEFGINHQGDVFNAGFTAFETVIDDYIYDYVNYTLSAATYPKDNIGRMRLRGIEAFWGFSLDNFDALLTYSTVNSKLSADENYVSMDFDDGTAVITQEGFDGARADRSYGDTYSMVLDYFVEFANLQLHYDFMHVSGMPAGKDLDGASLDNSKDGFSVHNISARWTPTQFVEGLSLTLGVDNLLDEYYTSQASRTGVSFHPVFGQLYLNDYEPGRNIKASVAYQF